MSKEVMRKALEALEKADRHCPVNTEAEVFVRLAIPALREALAEQPAQQEPVACQYAKDVAMPEYCCVGRCQYDTSPPAQRKPLSEEWIAYCWRKSMIGTRIHYVDYLALVREIERAHNIKENT